MTGANGTCGNETDLATVEIAIPRLVQFWLYAVSDGLSLACSFFILYCLLFDRALRSALHNHAIMIVLFVDIIYELTDIPWILYYYRYGVPWLSSPLFARFWAFADYGLYGTQIVLFAWATIERHILIFHDRWILTKRRCFYIHYLPLIVLPTYTVLFYIVGSFFVRCADTINYSLASGAPVPCLYAKPAAAKYDLIVNQIAPVLIIVVFSLALLVRVLWQRYHMRQPIQWRKHRKIIVQLLLISVVYLAFASPWSLVLLAYEFGLSRSVGVDYLRYAAFFSYYTVFLFPFMCCLSLSELRVKLKQKLLWYQRPPRVAHAGNVTVAPPGSRRTVLPLVALQCRQSKETVLDKH